MYTNSPFKILYIKGNYHLFQYIYNSSQATRHPNIRVVLVSFRPKIPTSPQSRKSSHFTTRPSPLTQMFQKLVLFSDLQRSPSCLLPFMPSPQEVHIFMHKKQPLYCCVCNLRSIVCREKVVKPSLFRILEGLLHSG